MNPVGAQHHPQTRSMSKKADANQTNLRSWVLKEKAQSDNKAKVLKGRQTEKPIEDLQTIVERFDVTLSQADEEFVEKLTEVSKGRQTEKPIEDIQTIVERFDVTLSQTDREFVEKLTEGSSESNGKRKN